MSYEDKYKRRKNFARVLVVGLLGALAGADIVMETGYINAGIGAVESGATTLLDSADTIGTYALNTGLFLGGIALTAIIADAIRISVRNYDYGNLLAPTGNKAYEE